MAPRERDVLVDLCVQKEYLSGGQQCCNAEAIRGNLRRLIAFARLRKLPVLSCVDESFPPPNGHKLFDPPAHGAPDSGRPAFARLANHTRIQSDNHLCVSLDIFRQFQHVILTKVHYDPFTNPKLDRLLTELPQKHFVVYGLPVETSVRILVLGLLRRNREVTLISDASGYWSEQEASMVMRQMNVKGCHVKTTAEYISEANTRLLRRPHFGGRSVA